MPSCTRLPTPPARLWPSRRNSCPCSRTRVSSTPVAAGCAWCSTRRSPRSPAGARRRPHRRSARSAIPMAELPTGDLTEDGPAYEVMYLLDADDDVDPAAARGTGTARRLPGRGRRRGPVERARPRRRRGCRGRGRHPGRFAPPDRGHPLRRAGRPSPREARRAPRTQAAWPSPPGPGLVELFTEAGAEVIEGGPGRRPSTGQILAAIEATGAEEVVVLPNDGDSDRRRRGRCRTRRGDAACTWW